MRRARTPVVATLVLVGASVAPARVGAQEAVEAKRWTISGVLAHGVFHAEGTWAGPVVDGAIARTPFVRAEAEVFGLSRQSVGATIGCTWTDCDTRQISRIAGAGVALSAEPPVPDADVWLTLVIRAGAAATWLEPTLHAGRVPGPQALYFEAGPLLRTTPKGEAWVVSATIGKLATRDWEPQWMFSARIGRSF